MKRKTRAAATGTEPLSQDSSARFVEPLYITQLKGADGRKLDADSLRKRREQAEAKAIGGCMPPGSVVKLKGREGLWMIVYTDKGEFPTSYTGCPFPEGLRAGSVPIPFHHDDIDRVYFVGFLKGCFSL